MPEPESAAAQVSTTGTADDVDADGRVTPVRTVRRSGAENDGAVVSGGAATSNSAHAVPLLVLAAASVARTQTRCWPLARRPPRPSTMTGVALCSPTHPPSLPSRLRPQQRTAPDTLRAHVNDSPPTTCATPCAAAVTGVALIPDP